MAPHVLELGERDGLTSLLVVLDGPGRAHSRKALEEHRRWCKVNEFPMPAPLGDLLLILGREQQHDTGSHTTTDDGLPDGLSHPPLALTYDAVAGLLSCSVRTVTRLVAFGELRTVSFGGGRPRVLRADLDSYLERKRMGDNAEGELVDELEHVEWEPVTTPEFEVPRHAPVDERITRELSIDANTRTV